MCPPIFHNMILKYDSHWYAIIYHMRSDNIYIYGFIIKNSLFHEISYCHYKPYSTHQCFLGLYGTTFSFVTSFRPLYKESAIIYGFIIKNSLFHEISSYMAKYGFRI